MSVGEMAYAADEIEAKSGVLIVMFMVTSQQSVENQNGAKNNS